MQFDLEKLADLLAEDATFAELVEYANEIDSCCGGGRF